MAGLAPQTLRESAPESLNLGDGLTVEIEAPPADAPEIDRAGNVVRINHGDGGVTVAIEPGALGNVNKPKTKGWFDNLCDQIPHDERARISEELLRGIADDINSRQEWIEAQTQGMQLLGLKIELPGTQGSADGAPVEGMSKVRHPLLLEAVLRFQANARAEMLPTDGPVKIRDDDNNVGLPEDKLAEAFEKDLNHYLTSTATEYYPDTDRMFLKLGFGGTAFKKVYYCPLRNRPVSETVEAKDLIVGANVTDLANARRVTHRVTMLPSTVKRLQILGVYRDLELSTPNEVNLNSLDREEAAQQGVSTNVMNPADRDREIYECYCELNIQGFEHELKGRPSGLDIPYRVTIDVTTREILSITRNYDEETEELPEARVSFVKYSFVPGFGFYDIGLLHILGNTTNAVTAAWREMLDNGMFANFPGFLIAKSATRQQTTVLRIPPGAGQQVDTNGMKIQDAVMKLPYETSGQAALQGLAGEMAATGQRLGGTAEIATGEGKSDAPVGTTLALIDQATKIENSVHRRMHASQAAEFALLVRCFKEHPQSFWQRKGKSEYPWDEATFMQALALCEAKLVPQADPNTASHTQRLMKVVALKQLQGASPQQYDGIAVDTVALQTLGFSNPEQFFAKPEQQTQNPEIIKGLADIQNDGKRADAALISAKANMARAQGAGVAPPAANDGAETQLKAEGLKLKARELDQKAHESAQTFRNEQEDREADHHMEILRLARDVLKDHTDREDVAEAAQQAEALDQGIEGA